MLENYLNQKAYRKTCTGTDDRGQLTYSAITPIPCRKQARIQTVMAADGRLVTTQHVYYTKHKVEPGDMLDGKVVMAVADWTCLDGSVLGRKAVL